MRGSGWMVAFFMLVLVAAVALGVGIPAYNMGIAQGMADSGKIVVPPAAGAPYMYGWHGYYGPFGFLACLIPFFFLFLFFGVLRTVLWRGRWGGHGYGHAGMPPMFEEWHKRAHGETPPTT